MDFALKTASRLDFAALLDLAAELGCVGVEPRNDLGRSFLDGIAPERAAAVAHDRDLRFLGLSEVYPFDDWNAERRAAVTALIETAEATGAETASLIPRIDARDPDEAARAATLRSVLTEIAPLLDGKRATALLEPIGFATCSMKFQREAAAAIDVLGLGDRFGIVHDTFQHALAGDPTSSFPYIRIVHVSGVSGGSGAFTDAQDVERGLLDASDRTGADRRLDRLPAAHARRRVRPRQTGDLR